MPDQPKQIGGGRRTIGDVAPKLAALTDDVLFEGCVEPARALGRDRSLITVATLITSGDADQLAFHLRRGPLRTA